METTKIYRHGKHITVQARTEQIEKVIDDFEDIFDEETVTIDEWKTYILPAEKLMKDLAKTVDERAKSYIDIQAEVI